MSDKMLGEVINFYHDFFNEQNGTSLSYNDIVTSEEYTHQFISFLMKQLQGVLFDDKERTQVVREIRTRLS